MNAPDEAMIVDVIVSLKHRENLFRGLHDLSHGNSVFDGVIARFIKSLVNKNNGRFLRLIQVILQPTQLLCWNVGVGPLKVVAAVGRSVFSETSIQNDKVVGPKIKRIKRALLPNPREKLVFGESCHAMIAEHKMFLAWNRREFGIDLVKPEFFDFNIFGGVNQVA